MSASRWDGWMAMSPEEQQRVRDDYLAEIRRESEDARARGYPGLQRALRMSEAEREAVLRKQRP